MREAANKYMGVQNKCKCGTPQLPYIAANCLQSGLSCKCGKPQTNKWVCRTNANAGSRKQIHGCAEQMQMREAANKYMGVQNKCKCGTPQLPYIMMCDRCGNNGNRINTREAADRMRLATLQQAGSR